MAGTLKRISTHVLDTTLGKPAAAILVQLDFHESEGKWTVISSSRTDADGRCAQLLSEPDAFQEGLYRVTFYTAAYFKAQGIVGLYPYVEITFQVRGGESHFHIPLLLSPNGY